MQSTHSSSATLRLKSQLRTQDIYSSKVADKHDIAQQWWTIVFIMLLFILTINFLKTFIACRAAYMALYHILSTGRHPRGAYHGLSSRGSRGHFCSTLQFFLAALH